MKHNELGFSFIELSITLAIIAILAAISYPSYLHHTLKAHRLEGKTALLNLAASMEHYYLLNNTYQNATLAKLGIPSSTPHDYYQLHITSANTDSYLLEAKPINSQQNDTVCGTLTYDHLGNKGSVNGSNTQTCWE
jgi:type IV pilus assembly protein PilE